MSYHSLPSNSLFQLPLPYNEPVLNYAPNSEERNLVKATLQEMRQQEIEICPIINGEKIATGDTAKAVMPSDHQHTLATYHRCSKDEVEKAIQASLDAKASWSATPFEERAAIFLRAAQMLSQSYRPVLNAATMLGQGKTAHQAEIDSACELIDFFRFNVFYMQHLYREQPLLSDPGIWNRLEHRPLEGFTFAVTPFNFTAIAGNLPTCMAMMGNTVVWKPASTAVFSGHYIMKLLEDAGLPPGVINFVPGSGATVGDPVMAHPDLAGLHFTGSTRVFQNMWKTVGTQIANYKTYPRIVGETGGKDFVMVHPSANVDQVKCALVRGAFEYQGQKCSAASRAYIPESIWKQLKEPLVEEIKTIKTGCVTDFSNFMSAVIDQNSFDNIKDYIEHAKASSDSSILVGGGCDDSEGFFVEPTVILTTNPHYRSMQEEIFGPVLTIYVYADKDFDQALTLCDQTSPYALTGAIFARDRQAVMKAKDHLANAAGNFYINDKPTGAVVGQQPFGGARGSGTNDKAGSALNLLRWVSPRTIKENFNPPTDYRYPFLETE